MINEKREEQRTRNKREIENQHDIDEECYALYIKKKEEEEAKKGGIISLITKPFRAIRYKRTAIGNNRDIHHQYYHRTIGEEEEHNNNNNKNKEKRKNKLEREKLKIQNVNLKLK